MLTKLTAKINPPTLNFIPANDVERLKAWIERGRVERFLVETMVSPAMAQELLSRNDDNRSLRVKMVEEYSASMVRGEWAINGQNIIISDDGRLNDGQHRLHAIITAGVSVPIGLHFGVSRASVATVDVGGKRTLGDHLAMKKHAYANILAATVRAAWNYDSGVMSLSMSPSATQALDYIDANPGVKVYLTDGAKIGTQFKTSGSQLAFAAFVCARINKGVADELMARVNDGLGLSAANLPAARVRERLMGHLTGKKPLNRNEAAAIFIIAFNAALVGRRMRLLSWSSNGVNAEAFPIAGA